MNINRYNAFDLIPFSSFRLFDEALNRATAPASAKPWTPAVDILETENELILKADLPEVKLSELDIRVEDGTLILRGERKFEKVENEKGYHRIERSYGNFSRSFTLPESVNPEAVKATFKEGVLTVTLHKKEVAKPKQIKVEVQTN